MTCTDCAKPMPRRGRPQVGYATEIARLDEISRQRALTEAESIVLERMLWRVEKKSRRRASYGSNRELARAGIDRRAV